ncbi:MAG: acyl-[ACP]--phospholipid O-acyltransferase [Nitrospirales bacterium]|nr:MAG: acyl-[ACP]--phospholipid O-acyltransferase [Nitrospirales bacterium]
MTSSSSPHPLRGLLITQFCGAFNDNAWKLMVALLAIKQVSSELGGTGPEFEAAAQTHTTITFVIFTLPMMIISVVAGVFSDRFSKRSVIIAMKWVEVGFMALGTVALFHNPAGGILPLVILAGMGAQSALYSPAKYGILPEILPHERLTAGNGSIELWTFAAIITGTAAGGILLDMTGVTTWLAGFFLTTLALVGLLACYAIPHVPPARSEGGVSATVASAWTAVQSDQVLRFGILGAIMFWTIASLVGQDIIIYGKAVLGLSDSQTGLPLAAFGVGIGIGAVLAGKLSGPKVEYGLIPLGAVGLSLCLLCLGFSTPQLFGTLLWMCLLGVASGFVVVPINALIQWRAPHDRRGAVIAMSNSAVFSGVFIGSLSAGLFSGIGISTSGILIVSGGFTLCATIWGLTLLPDAFLRVVLSLLTNTFYRLTIVHREHVPQEGGALLVANHVSFIDGLLILASLDRPVRFIVDRYYYEHPLFRRLARIMGAVPISSTGTPREILTALRDAGRHLDEGDLVCIFPEGQITRTGGLLPFRQGFERIAKGRDVPIIPVHLDRVWGSIFSFIGGKFLMKLPERIPYPVTVSYGAPLPSDTPAHTVRHIIQEMGEAAWHHRKSSARPLHHSFVWAMRRHPFRFAFGDLTRPHVSCLEALTGAVALARALRPHWDGQHTVGILLPASVAGALTNVAATLSGRTTVNLNFTAGQTGMESAAKQASLQTIVTSRMFVEKATLHLPKTLTIIWLEDIRNTITSTEKMLSMLLAVFAPMTLLERSTGAACRPTTDDLATIIFSSGSTGEPKGVMLSHFNIDSNVEAVAQSLHIDKRDRILGILPFFHSFGYLATLWFPTIHGAGVVYHPSPLDAAAIGNLVHQYRITVLLTTPTFLQLYLRRCTPEQFGALRMVVTGAEKLSNRLLDAFEERFGIRPIEGYGVTECAPVIAVNCPDFRAAGFFQPASRRGTVGQPLPGVSIRIVDPDSFEPLPIDSPGMLLVKGPNVMKGYLGREDLTANAMRDGWYITGDIAKVDEDGFIAITDRLSRFSKIGGEMVPHGKVEEALHHAAHAETQVLAVTSVPDEKKGEQLAVLHMLDEETIPELLDNVSASGLPNLFIPRKDYFIKVEQLPVLGTGKLDLRALKQIAKENLHTSN